LREIRISIHTFVFHMAEALNIRPEMDPSPSVASSLTRAAKSPIRPHTAGRERTTAPLETSASDGAQAEIFYLQKQVQSQTLMVIHLEDSERLEGKIEWYDRDTIKICSKTRQRVLIFKSAIKYIHKAAEQHPVSSGQLR
jgi:sRNA-binding regulator protein Hfq